MLVARYLWLLLCYAQYARSTLLDDYQEISTSILSPLNTESEVLPVSLGVDRSSGCICRATRHYNRVVCFGNYDCRRFPKIKVPTEILKVRTTVIVRILKGELDTLHDLKVLEIEANHQLAYLQPGLFKNLTKLQQLSISYNTHLLSLAEKTFEGLVNLRNLTLVNNGFHNILDITPTFRTSVLPMLTGLDLSENSIETIPENAFAHMRGSLLTRLDINLCRIDYIHPKTFRNLKHLKELRIGENDLDPDMIGEFLMDMINEGINLTYLDLAGMGFRKQPPRNLMDIVANTTVKKLILAQNQFEIINDESFPAMKNIELLDLRRVLAIVISSNAFDPTKFPNLKVLLLSGNNLPGIHKKLLSNQLLLLDLSNNKGSAANPMYYEIDRNTFIQSKELRILNLAYNRIRAIFNYTFTGLENLRILSMENGTLYHIGKGTFKTVKHLEILNLANNPLTANENLTSSSFAGLNELKILILRNCGIRHLYDEDNIFEMMPNLTHLILRNNQLFYITAETLKPLKHLQMLDLSENLFVSWWKPLFMASGIVPRKLYLTNNKISHFSISMIQDISYLLENSVNYSIEINLMDNIFICDCNNMYRSHLWIVANGSVALKNFFATSKFQCSSPDWWEDRRVSEYLSSIESVHCLMYEKISNIMLLVWTAPSIVTIILIAFVIFILYKYRMYVRYWLFLAKLALGKKLARKSTSAQRSEAKGYKYDAFVSYCHEDRDFVVEMVAQMETNSPYLKLCVYERDFEIGSFISEAILSSINESKYVILIISNGFAKSQWCRWETQLAEYHRIFLEDGSCYDPLVLIKRGDVESKYMTPTLKYLLKTKIYHMWDEQRPDEFWRKLRNTVGKTK